VREGDPGPDGESEKAFLSTSFALFLSAFRCAVARCASDLPAPLRGTVSYASSLASLYAVDDPPAYEELRFRPTPSRLVTVSPSIVSSMSSTASAYTSERTSECTNEVSVIVSVAIISARARVLFP
jgi:hypothetical protein